MEVVIGIGIFLFIGLGLCVLGACGVFGQSNQPYVPTPPEPDYDWVNHNAKFERK